jgi:hypothetical protein
MRRILKALGWLSLVLAGLSLMLTAMSWPPGGLFFALPYLFLISSVGLGLVGGVLLLLTRTPPGRGRPNESGGEPDHKG